MLYGLPDNESTTLGLNHIISLPSILQLTTLNTKEIIYFESHLVRYFYEKFILVTFD